MVSPYKIVKFYDEISDSEMAKIASSFSNNSLFLKANDNKTVIFKFSVEKYISDIKKLSNYVSNKFYYPILSNYKFIGLLKNEKELSLEFCSAELKQSNGLMTEDKENNLNEDIYKHICENKIRELTEILDEESIELTRMDFKINNCSQGKLSKNGLFYLNDKDIEKQKKTLLMIANFLLKGEINEEII